MSKEEQEAGKEGLHYEGRDVEGKDKPSPSIFSKKWSNADQNTSDKSPLAKIINQAVYMFVFPACKNKKLTQKDIEEVNLGGALVGLLVYLIPNFSPNNPIILFPVRCIMLFVKVRHICSVIGEKVEDIKKKVT